MLARTALLARLAGAAPISVTPSALSASVKYLTDAYRALRISNEGNRSIQIEFEVPEIQSGGPYRSAALPAAAAAPEPTSSPAPPRVTSASPRQWDYDRIVDYLGASKPALTGAVLKSSSDMGFSDLLALRDLTAAAAGGAAHPLALLQASHEAAAAGAGGAAFRAWNETLSKEDDGFALDLAGRRRLAGVAGADLLTWTQNVAHKLKMEGTHRVMAGRRAGARAAGARRRLLGVPAVVSVHEAGEISVIEFDPGATEAALQEALLELAAWRGEFTFLEPDTRVWASRCPRLDATRARVAAEPLLGRVVEFSDAAPSSECGRLLQAPNDPLWSQQWGPQWAGAGSAWQSHRGDEEGLEDVIVCVVDTGVDYRHPDLAENMWVNEAELNGSPGVDDDGNGYVDDIYGINALRSPDDPRAGDPLDDNSHGSHCAGVIAARGNNALGIVGVNRRAKIMACKFLGSDGGGAVSNAVKCIDYAIANGVRVLSNSWGGSGSRALKEAAARSQQAGILFLAAAGNQFQNNDLIPTFPANYGLELDNVVAVAATDQRGLSPFSNYGARTVHLAAPGSNILSTVRNGAYASLSGTSMACPAVAGLTSLVLSANPALDYRQVIEVLRRGVKPMPDLERRTLWGGVADFDATLEAVLGRKVLRPVPSWTPWLTANITLAPRETLRLPFAVYGLQTGDFASQIAIVARDPDTRDVLDRKIVPWRVQVEPRPQLNTDELPERLTLLTEPASPSLPVTIHLTRRRNDSTDPLTLRFSLLESTDPDALLTSIPLDGRSDQVVVPAGEDFQFTVQCLPVASAHQIRVLRDEGLPEPVESILKVSCEEFQLRIAPAVLTDTDGDLLLMVASSCNSEHTCVQPPVGYLAYHVPEHLAPIQAYKPRIWNVNLFWANLPGGAECLLSSSDQTMSVLRKTISQAPDFEWSVVTPDDADDGSIEYRFRRMSAFNFFNIEYDRLRIYANGWVSFGEDGGSDAADSWSGRLHMDDEELDAIAAYWTDLKQATILVGESADELVVQWLDAVLYNDLRAQRLSLQILLTKNGSILLGYRNLIYEPAAQIGLKAGRRRGSAAPLRGSRGATAYRRIAPLDRLYGYLVKDSVLVYSPKEARGAQSRISFLDSNDAYNIGVMRESLTTLHFRRPLGGAPQGAAAADGYIKVLASTPLVQQALKVMRVGFTPDTASSPTATSRKSS